MTPRTRRPTARSGLYLGAIAVLIGIGIIALCSGCTGSSGAARAAASPATAASTTSQATTSRPQRSTASPEPAPSWAQPAHVDAGNATDVGRAALAVMFTQDTVTDTSSMQAQIRAGAFLQPAYLAALKAVPVTAPGAQWETWAAHRAYTSTQVTVGTDTRPTDTETLAERQYSVVVTPIGRDGWRGAPESFTAFVELTRTSASAPWRLAAVETSN